MQCRRVLACGFGVEGDYWLVIGLSGHALSEQNSYSLRYRQGPGYCPNSQPHFFPENSDASTLILIPQGLTTKITTPETIVPALIPTANGTTRTCPLLPNLTTSFRSQLSGYTCTIHGNNLPWTRRSSHRVTRCSPHGVMPQLSVSELVSFGLN